MPQRASLLSVLLSCLVLAGGYLAVAASLETAEIVAALVSAFAAVMLTIIVSRTSRRTVRLRAAWLPLAAHVLGAVARDLARLALVLTSALVRGRHGRIDTMAPPDTGQAAYAGDHTALAVLLVSVAPNTYVLTTQDARLRVHRLA